MTKVLCVLAFLIVLCTAHKSGNKFVILDDFVDSKLEEKDDIIQVHIIPHTHDVNFFYVLRLRHHN